MYEDEEHGVQYYADDSQGYGENIIDNPTLMSQVTYVTYDYVYEPNDEYVYEPNDEYVYEPNEQHGYDAKKQYKKVDKERKLSLWERIKGFFAKLAQRDGVVWDILNVFIDTTLASLTGPFFVIAQVIINGVKKWIRTKVEGKVAEYLSQYYYA